MGSNCFCFWKRTKLACILEASESTRMRMEESPPKYHEDHIAGKGENSLQHYNLVHKFIPMPQAMKIPAAKAAVDKEWEKLENISAWNLTKVRSKKEVIDEARTSGATVHFSSLMDICHLKNAELEAKHQKYKGRVVLRGDIVKDDSGSYAVFTEQGSSASQMTAAKIMDIISRLPGCAGQAADAVSAYTQVKMEDAPKLLNIPKSECPDIWIRLPRHKWPKSWSSMEAPVVPLERNLCGHPLAGLSWERQNEEILLKYGWEKIPNWECLFVQREKGIFLSVYVDDIKLAGKNRTLIRCGKYSIKKSIWENQHLSLIMYTWAALKDNVKQAKILWTITEPCLNPEFPWGELKNYHARKICVSLRGPTIWKVMKRNVRNDVVSWQTGRLNNSTKSLLHASMTTTSKKSKDIVDNYKSIFESRISAGALPETKSHCET